MAPMAFAWHSKSILGSGSQLMASDWVKAQALHVKGYPNMYLPYIFQALQKWEEKRQEQIISYYS